MYRKEILRELVGYFIDWNKFKSTFLSDKQDAERYNLRHTNTNMHVLANTYTYTYTYINLYIWLYKDAHILLNRDIQKHLHISSYIHIWQVHIYKWLKACTYKYTYKTYACKHTHMHIIHMHIHRHTHLWLWDCNVFCKEFLVFFKFLFRNKYFDLMLNSKYHLFL